MTRIGKLCVPFISVIMSISMDTLSYPLSTTTTISYILLYSHRGNSHKRHTLLTLVDTDTDTDIDTDTDTDTRQRTS